MVTKPDPSRAKQRRGEKTQSLNQRITSVDILLFVIPICRVIQIRAVGILSGADILLLLVFLTMVIRKKITLQAPGAKKVIALCAIWLVSQCVTDIVRHTAFHDYARSWSNIGLTIVNFSVFFTLLYDRPRRILFYGSGLAVAAVIVYLFNPDVNMKLDPWKFAFGFAVSWSVFLALSRRRHNGYSPVIVSALMGLVNIGFGSRSLGGFSLATSLYLFLALRYRRNTESGVKIQKNSVVTIAALLLFGICGILWAYQYAARSGVLGVDAQTKYEKQSSGKFGILLGGRVEMLGSIPAILDSPILGHGSWARDPKYFIIERRAQAALGYKGAEDNLSMQQAQMGYIPAHSFILGAWVDAGIFGALFWIWALAFVVRCLFRLYSANTQLLPYATFLAFSLLWDIPYSPYASLMRIISPFFIVVLMTCVPPVAQKEVVAPVRRQKRVALSTTGAN